MEIKVENVSKYFKKVSVLQDVNMEFKEGNIYGLYGRNGSGKSVFLKIMSNLYKPSKGRILFDGKENDFNRANGTMGALIENPNFFPELTGLENLKLLAKIQNKIGEKEILEVLDKVNLSKEKDKKVKEYSLGMKQKLGIAQAIMEDQKIILLDEPFNGVDAGSVTKIMNILKEIKKDKIIILSSHIKEDLENLCDKIYYFDTGVVKEE